MRRWFSLVVLLLVFGALLVTRPSPAAPEKPKLRVAVLTPRDLPGAPPWRANALAESVAERLKVVPGWGVLARQPVIQAEAVADRAGTSGETRRANIATAVKADLVIESQILSKEDGKLAVSILLAGAEGTTNPQELPVEGEGPAELWLSAVISRGAIKAAKEEAPPLFAGLIDGREAASLEAFARYAKGALALAQRDVFGAEALLREAVALDPNYSQAAALLSRVLCIKSQLDPASLEEALLFAEQAVKSASASPNAQVALGRVHDYAERFTKAEEEYTEALALAPFDVTALNNRGRIRLSVRRQFRAARQDFEKALSVDPGFWLARINLTKTDIAMGDGAAAVEVITPLAEANPEDLGVQLQLAEALSSAGRSAPALKLLGELEAKFPAETRIPYYQGLAYLSSGSYQKAITALEKALKTPQEQDPSLPSFAKDALAWANALSSDLTKAASLLEELTTNSPEFIPGWRDMGIVKAWQGDLSGARRAFASGAQFAPKDPELLYNSGVALLALGELVDAEEAFSRAVALDPDFAQGWYNLGVAQSQAGRPKDAKEAFSRAASLAPEDVLARIGLGLSLRAQKKPKEAKEALKEAAAIAKEPDEVFRAKLNLGLLCAEQGDVDCARTMLSAVSQNPPKGREAQSAHAKSVLVALKAGPP